MNKIAVITGGSRGLGRSGVLALAERGVSSIFTYYNNVQAACDVVAEVAENGGKAVALPCDARDIAYFPVFAERLREVLKVEFQRDSFDYLLNNAGSGMSASIADTRVEALDEMYGIHVRGPFFLTQTLYPLIADGGHVVNVSSGLTRFSMPGSAAYAMAKGAVEVMTRYMAKEFAERQIRVNTLAPGAIATDFRGGAVRDNAHVGQMIASVTALGRVGQADDIGKLISALFSDGMEWVTGQRIEASGGMFL